MKRHENKKNESNKLTLIRSLESLNAKKSQSLYVVGKVTKIYLDQRKTLKIWFMTNIQLVYILQWSYSWVSNHLARHSG
jgi:hypothetical protein